jgi:hypothetical protein
MNLDILIPLVVIIGCIIFIVIYKPAEQFKSEFRESDIFLKNPVPTFISNLENKKDLIISNEDKNNNFPLKPIEIEAPTIKYYTPKPEEPYKDVNFDKIRDKNVDIKMKQDAIKNDNEYKDIINAALGFNYPKNSGDFLTEINVKDISKDELDNSTLADIFKKTTAKVIKHVSDEQIKNILGKPIEEKRMVNNLYKPEVILVDKNLEISNNTNNITYKFSGFNELPIGSYEYGAVNITKG